MIKKKIDFVEVTFAIEEGQKVFIDRINIFGNAKTVDNVIRRELELVEGDPYNSFKIRQSERNIRSTGLFENVDLQLDQISGSNKANVDVNIIYIYELQDNLLLVLVFPLLMELWVM